MSASAGPTEPRARAQAGKLGGQSPQRAPPAASCTRVRPAHPHRPADRSAGSRRDRQLGRPGYHAVRRRPAARLTTPVCDNHPTYPVRLIPRLQTLTIQVPVAVVGRCLPVPAGQLRTMPGTLWHGQVTGESSGGPAVFAAWRADRLPCSGTPAGVAQLAEQPSCKRQVSGSNPLTGSKRSSRFSREIFTFGLGPAVRLSWARTRADVPRVVTRKRLAQLRTRSPACGLAALNLWAGMKEGRIRAGKSQT